MTTTNKTIDLGNNETKSSGVFEVPGGFLAMTFSQSKTFKTRAGAERWHARHAAKPSADEPAPRTHSCGRRYMPSDATYCWFCHCG